MTTTMSTPAKPETPVNAMVDVRPETIDPQLWRNELGARPWMHFLSARHSQSTSVIEVEVLQMETFALFIRELSDKVLLAGFRSNQLLVGFLHDRPVVSFSISMTHPERAENWHRSLSLALVAVPV